MTLLRGAVLLSTLVLFGGAVVPQAAVAAIWSVKADCSEGAWSVSVELAGFGAVDASCADGNETEVVVDVGDLVVTGVRVAATSSAGTLCDLPAGDALELELECASKTEDAAGFELEDRVEVEIELEDDEREEE